jgi:hypothetical protein
VSAAVEGTVRFNTVPDDLAVAVCACRRQGVNRALETIEGSGVPVPDDLKRLVVVVAADFAFRHDWSPLAYTLCGVGIDPFLMSCGFARLRLRNLIASAMSATLVPRARCGHDDCDRPSA